MPLSVNIIKLLDKIESPLKDVLIEILTEIEKQRKQREESVTKTEFNELKNIVAELAKAQKRTEQRIADLTEAQKKTEQRLSELAEAQKHAEQRITRLEIAVQELTEAQKKTEQRLNELAEAQKKTEQRVNELAEAQKKTEQRVNELAEAQRRTEEELRKLITAHRRTREELGGLSHTVGYILEDRAYEALPPLLKKEFGIEIMELKRDFVEVSPNRFEEINILGQGRKNGTRIWILGKCKTQLKKKDVDGFLKRLSRMEHLFPGERLLIVVTYQTSPQVREYIKEKGLKLYFSYELRSNLH